MSSNIKPFEPEEFKRQAHLVIDFLVDYYKNANNYPVRSQVEPGYLKKRAPESAPHDPEPIEHILRDVQKDIIPGLTHWQSPNFFAYYPCNVSTAGFLGEMICTGFNVPGFDWISSPAATELEIIVMEWIGKMLQLPTKFLSSGTGGGVLHGTTCEAMLTTIVAARDRMLSKVGSNGINTLVVYASDQTHCAFQKAAGIAGIPRHNFRTVPTARADNFALAPAALKAAVETDVAAGLVPLFLCSTVGTTSSASVDPLGPLCDVARAYGMWVHVDGAYAASACICPEYRHYIDGVEKSDSFSFNAHKWFFTTLDCCCLWVKDPTALVRALSTDPEFLKNSASESKQVVDFKDWQITLSRRFRSMKLWFVLRSYGVANLRRFIREHIRMSRSFERMVKGDRRFEVVVPRSFSTVCFRVSPVERGGEAAANERNAALLEAINKSGKIFMTHAVIGGVYVMRFVIGGSLTESRHVDRAWKVVVEHANAMLF